jgi:hypothetical protein
VRQDQHHRRPTGVSCRPSGWQGVERAGRPPGPRKTRASWCSPEYDVGELDEVDSVGVRRVNGFWPLGVAETLKTTTTDEGTVVLLADFTAPATVTTSPSRPDDHLRRRDRTRHRRDPERLISGRWLCLGDRELQLLVLGVPKPDRGGDRGMVEFRSTPPSAARSVPSSSRALCRSRTPC